MPRFISKVGRLAWRALAAPDVRSRQIALSFGTSACNIAAFAFCAWATGTHISLGAATALVPLILIAMLIPVGIAGWGFRESAAAALFPMIGATAGAGVAASVAFGGMLLAASVPGLLPIVVGDSRQSRAGRAGYLHAPMPLPIQRRPRDLADAGRRSMTSVAGTATRDWRAPP
jgi:Lysylphosphatidylglycerol synthase TM region